MTTKIADSVASEFITAKLQGKDILSHLGSAKFLVGVLHINDKYAKASEKIHGRCDEFASKDEAFFLELAMDNSRFDLYLQSGRMARLLENKVCEGHGLTADELSQLDKLMVERFQMLAKFRENIRKAYKFAFDRGYTAFKAEYKMFGFEK